MIASGLCRWLRFLFRTWEKIQRAGGGADFFGGDSQIFYSRRQAAVSKQELNPANIGSVFQQVDGESVTHGMGRDGFGNAGKRVRLLTCNLDGMFGDGIAGAAAGKTATRWAWPSATS